LSAYGYLPWRLRILLGDCPLLITLTCHAPNASDVGYLFGKNPASLFAREPLWRVHQAVFGVLALESEPVDPRL
jgi:hypothetical protein